MSVEVLAWAFKQPIAGNEKCVLLALADRARDDGVCWPGLKDVAGRACVSEKTVQRILAKLEERGLLTRERRNQPDGGRASDLIRLAVTLSGGASGQMTGGLADSHAHTGTNRQNRLSLGAGGSARKPVKYRGKRVPEVVVEQAERLLGIFNEETQRSMGTRTGDGDASPAVKQIIGAMIARPEADPDAWEDAVRNTVANPPRWAEGDVQLGTVFGLKAADTALSNSGAKAARRSRDPAKQARVESFKGALERLAGGGG